MSGQSVIDRLNAAKHSLAGQGLAKAVCKATTEEVMGPKRKHLDYLLQCTNEPNVSTPQMADLLIERTQSSNWIVVFKALITIHNLMNYGNEKFFQYLASNNCSVSLENFLDKSHVQGFDMSTYIRKYGKYINEKVISYRALAYDLCKVKKGKEDGLLRTMPADKMLKALSALQSQVDVLLEFDATPSDLVNGVISAAFLLICKDLIRLFACYNDGIINLLEKYFGLNRKQCREALDIYKQFLLRMDKISTFLKGAEPWAKKQNAGIDKDEIPDLAKAPASLLETLEAHLATLEAKRKRSKPRATDVAAASATTEAVATVNGSSAAATTTGGQAQSQQQQEAQKDSSSTAEAAAAALPGASPKVDRPAKPKAKKKTTPKSAKEAKSSVEPPGATATQLSPRHAAPPRPPPVSKTPQTLSPVHSADTQNAASAGAAEASSLLLLLEPDCAPTKPSDDLLELSVGAGEPAADADGKGVAALLQMPEPLRLSTSASSKLVASDAGTTGRAENILKPTARSSSPARPSSNVDLLSALSDPVEPSSVATLETAKDLSASDSAAQQQDILAKLSLKSSPAKAAPAVVDKETTGFFLLDFDSSQADSSSLDVAESKTAAAAASSSSSSSSPAPQPGANAFVLDLLGSPLDAGSAVILAEGSQAAVMAGPTVAMPSTAAITTTTTAADATTTTKAQPAAAVAASMSGVRRASSATAATAATTAASQQPSASTTASAAPSTSVDTTSSSAGDLLELLLAPVTPAAAAPVPTVVDDPLGVNLLAPIAATKTAKNSEIDLLSLEPELDELDSVSLLKSLDPLKSSSVTTSAATTHKNNEFEKLATAQPAVAAVPLIGSMAPTIVGKEFLKNQHPPLNQGVPDSGRPSPPPYSPRDPIEMAMVKNMNFNPISPTKNAPPATKQPLSTITKPTADVTKPAASIMTPAVAGGGQPGITAASATKNYQAPAVQESHKVSGTGAESMQPTRKAAQDKPLIGPDLDTSLISLASNLTAATGTQRQKSSFQWHPTADKKLTGGGTTIDSSGITRQPLSPTHATGVAGTATTASGSVDRPAGDQTQPQPKAPSAFQTAKQPSTATASSVAPAVLKAERSTEPLMDPFGSL